MKRTFITLVVALALVFLIRAFAFTSCMIPSAGMENTLFRGDRVIVNKWSYGLRLPLMSLVGYHRWCENDVRRGDILLFNNPAPKELGMPIDKREIFISRCVGKPGDTLMLNNELVLTGDIVVSPDDKFLYSYPGNQEDLLMEALYTVGIADNQLLGYDKGDYVRSFSHFELYLLKQELHGKVSFKALQTDTTDGVHPFVIPSKGYTVRVYPWNVKLLCNTINSHEGGNATLKGDTLLVDNKPVYSYLFKKDYCWVASSNSINIYDSRLFGFVPYDHLIGRASFIWFSKDEDQGWRDGYRWRRFFHKVQ